MTRLPDDGQRWRRVEELFHEALERPPDERRAFLAEASGGDVSLLREVASLLGRAEEEEIFRDGLEGLARVMTGASHEGARLGPYVLGPLIGRGGMGDVYRARDERLGRHVAIKLLPAGPASDPERRQRARREALALASLSHPNIAAIYGLEEGDGLTGLVLELVPGTTLKELLAGRGALPPGEALAIARQIAAALDAAHLRGIVHRDLKPANVAITPDGLVKVLDFGLARIDARNVDGGDDAAVVTTEGAILGTAAYMSPEQARSQIADQRTDVWAFGAVLFEMLTGQRAFEGERIPDTLAAVVHADPNLDRLPSSVPPHVRAAIERCLQKDPSERPRSVADVRMALEGAFAPPLLPARRSSSRAPWLAAAVLAGAAVGGVLASMVRPGTEAPAPAMRFSVNSPADFRFGGVALSPDGRSLAFIDDSEGRTGLWVHSFETGQSRRLERSERYTASMFWSSDGRSLAFVSGNWLWRIAVAGGPPQRIAEAATSAYMGGQWTADDWILYGRSDGGLLKVQAWGGTPVPVTELDPSRGETGHGGPVMLPDGRRFLYLREARDPRQRGVYVGVLDRVPADQPRQQVLSFGARPFVSQAPDGSIDLLYVQDGALLAQRLDAASLTTSGPPRVVLERIASDGEPLQVSVARDTIAVRPPAPPVGGAPTWLDRYGRSMGPVFDGAVPPAWHPRLSPDGTRLALVIDYCVWVYPLDGKPPIRLTSGASLSPVWTADGGSIVFESFGDPPGLYVIAADGSSSTPRRVGPSGHFHTSGVLGERGALAMFEPRDAFGSWWLVELPWSDDGQPRRLGDIVMPTPEVSAALSPDGRWIAYIASTTGRPELWVRRFPELDAATRVSPDGAVDPVWAKDGRSLYYIEGDRLMRVGVRDPAGLRFAYEPPVVLTEEPFLRLPQPSSYDVASDGRVLALAPVPGPSPAPVEVIVNWRSLPGVGRLE